MLDALRRLLLLQTGIADTFIDADPDELPALRALAERLPTALIVGAMHRFGDARPSAEHLPARALALELALVGRSSRRPPSGPPPRPLGDARRPGAGCGDRRAEGDARPAANRWEVGRCAAGRRRSGGSIGPAPPDALGDPADGHGRTRRIVTHPTPRPRAHATDRRRRHLGRAPQALAGHRRRRRACRTGTQPRCSRTAGRSTPTPARSAGLLLRVPLPARRRTRARRATIAAAVTSAIGGSARYAASPRRAHRTRRPRTSRSRQGRPRRRHAIDALGARVAGTKPMSTNPDPITPAEPILNARRSERCPVECPPAPR
ncbi:MAG: hypothetical protein U0470_01035 [Anaerolineae bacterium]